MTVRWAVSSVNSPHLRSRPNSIHVQCRFSGSKSPGAAPHGTCPSLIVASMVVVIIVYPVQSEYEKYISGKGSVQSEACNPRRSARTCRPGRRLKQAGFLGDLRLERHAISSSSIWQISGWRCRRRSMAVILDQLRPARCAAMGHKPSRASSSIRRWSRSGSADLRIPGELLGQRQATRLISIDRIAGGRADLNLVQQPLDKLVIFLRNRFSASAVRWYT